VAVDEWSLAFCGCRLREECRSRIAFAVACCGFGGLVEMHNRVFDIDIFGMVGGAGHWWDVAPVLRNSGACCSSISVAGVVMLAVDDLCAGEVFVS
jgi:hypothetical protein